MGQDQVSRGAWNENLKIFAACCFKISSCYNENQRCLFSKLGRSRDLKYPEDNSLDLLSFPRKNPIFQHSIFNISGFLEFKFINVCIVHLPLHLFPEVFLIFCCDNCKIFFNCCIEVNDKHRVCPSNVMAQNTEYIGLYGISQLRCDAKLTLRILHIRLNPHHIHRTHPPCFLGRCTQHTRSHSADTLTPLCIVRSNKGQGQSHNGYL